MNNSGTTSLAFHDCLVQLWQYLTVKDLPLFSDVAFVFGRDDFMIAEKALELYRKNVTPILVLLGGRGRASGHLKTAESKAFESFLLERGVPARALLTESKSTNTGENVDEGLRLLRDNSIAAKRVILVTHAPHSRRALAAARIRGREIEFISCPDECSLPDRDSPNQIHVAKELVGEVERLSNYAKMGYIGNEVIPPDIQSCASTIRKWIGMMEGRTRPEGKE